jgi:hypothetical protein
MKVFIAARAFQLDDPDPRVNADVFLTRKEAEAALDELGYTRPDHQDGQWVIRYDVDDPPVIAIAVILEQELKITIAEL